MGGATIAVILAVGLIALHTSEGLVGEVATYALVLIVLAASAAGIAQVDITSPITGGLLDLAIGVIVGISIGATVGREVKRKLQDDGTALVWRLYDD